MINIKDIKKEIHCVPSNLSEKETNQILNNHTINALCYEPFLEDLEEIIKKIRDHKIVGDIVEIGTWKGGIACYIKALLLHYQMKKSMWLADTFEGFKPEIDPIHSKDLEAYRYFSALNISIPTQKEVENLFKNLNIWDDTIYILKGDVKDTLPHSSIKHISLLHLDVDFYQPTYHALNSLYHNVSKGGYIIIDDYGLNTVNCKDAVDCFRIENNITQPIVMLNSYIAYWIK